MIKKYVIVISFLFAFFLPISTMAISLNQTVKPFSGQEITSGKAMDMTDIIGEKPVMIIFWASWCPNCKEEVPKINQLVEKYRDMGMAFIGINVGFNDSVKRAQTFMAQTKMQYPVIFDKGGRVSKQFSINGVPTIIVADRKGVVKFKNYGLPTISDDDFKELLNN